MVAWTPILNALPLVMEIIKIAKPVFTSNPDNKSTDNKSVGNNSEIIPTQITELQTAVTQNAESLTELATQLKSTIEGIDKAAINLQQELLMIKKLFKISLLISVLSISIAIGALLSH